MLCNHRPNLRAEGKKYYLNFFIFFYFSNFKFFQVFQVLRLSGEGGSLLNCDHSMACHGIIGQTCGQRQKYPLNLLLFDGGGGVEAPC